MNEERELLQNCNKINELLKQPEQDKIFKVIEKNRFNEGVRVGLASANKTIIEMAETKQDYLNENQRLTNSLLQAEDKIQELLKQPEQKPLPTYLVDDLAKISISNDMFDWNNVDRLFACAIEKAHGIGGGDE